MAAFDNWDLDRLSLFIGVSSGFGCAFVMAANVYTCGNLYLVSGVNSFFLISLNRHSFSKYFVIFLVCLNTIFLGFLITDAADFHQMLLDW